MSADSPRLALTPSTYVQVCCLAGSLTGRSFAFVDPAPMPLPQPLVLGRGADCHLCFRSASEDMVSRWHAELQLTATGVRFVDRSTHGSYLAETQQRLTTLEIARGAQAVVQLGPQGPICQIAVGIAVPFGTYSLVAKLGEGGMAEVYVAGDSRLDRFVVLKLLRPEMRRSDPLAAQHLLDEARVVAQLEHNQVIRIYEQGELGGVPYIAMEYLRGISLLQLREQLAELGQRLPPSLAAAIMRQALLGLHAAHELPSKVVHRDISPSNIVITRDTVKVIDFGIARADNRDKKTVTEPNTTKGCPPYMSPEQITAPQTVTRQSDLFSAAVVLYELCSGGSLFWREHAVATMTAVLVDEPPLLRHVCSEASERLELLLAGALAKKPAERWPKTAADFAAVLKEEAGPDFLHHDNIISALEELGVELQSSPPSPLREIPELLQHAPARISSEPRPRAQLSAELGARVSAEPRVSVEPGAAGTDWLLSVPLPEGGGSFELSTSRFHRLSVLSHQMHPREQREPIRLPLELDGLVSDCREPLVLALANRMAELRVAPETLKAGRSFRIYPAELSTTGARNSYTLPLLCPGKQLLVGHHRGDSRAITVASSAADPVDPAPLVLDLSELGLRLVAPAGTGRLFVVYSTEPQRSQGYLACFAVRRP